MKCSCCAVCRALAGGQELWVSLALSPIDTSAPALHEFVERRTGRGWLGANWSIFERKCKAARGGCFTTAHCGGFAIWVFLISLHFLSCAEIRGKMLHAFHSSGITPMPLRDSSSPPILLFPLQSHSCLLLKLCPPQAFSRGKGAKPAAPIRDGTCQRKHCCKHFRE